MTLLNHFTEFFRVDDVCERNRYTKFGATPCVGSFWRSELNITIFVVYFTRGYCHTLVQVCSDVYM